MKKKFFSIFKYVLLLIAGIGLLLLAFKGVNLRSTLDEISQVNIFWFSVSIAASLVAFFSRAYRWNMMIEPAGYTSRLDNTSYSLMIGYLANLAFPRLGEVSRCASLSKASKIPFEILFGTVIVERVIDVICLLICIILTAFLEYKRLGNFFDENLINPLVQKLGTLAGSVYFYVVLGAFILCVILIFFYFRKFSGEHRVLRKIADLFKGLVQGLRSVRTLKNPGAFLFHTFLIWFMYFLMSYTCLFALPATAGLDWKAGLFVLVVGGMGMSAPVQGGIGTYHLLVSQGLILFGLQKSHGLAYATLMHTSQTLIIILLGGISFLLLFLNQRKSNHVNT